MQRLFAFLLILFLSRQTFACLNGESKMLKDGTVLFEDIEGNVPYGHVFFKEDFEKRVKQLDILYKETKDLDFLSDKGLLLILLGRYNEAVKIYLDIEKLEPNRYSTASNIGTAYELLGQNEQALKWIRKSVEIDPDSHHNSEWIHVKILEAKIKGQEFYTTRFLLNTDFGLERKPVSELSRHELRKLSAALYYQLNERVSFVKPKEKIVAQLLFDLGNLAFLLGDYNDALADYNEAKKYGFGGELLELRMEEADKLNNLPEKENTTSKVIVHNTKPPGFFVKYGIWILSAAVLASLIAIMYRLKKKNA